MNAEQELKKMSKEHLGQSGFNENSAPPTPEAYRERKGQFDSLTKRVESSKSNYDGLRSKVRREQKESIAKEATKKQNTSAIVLEAVQRQTHKRKYF